MFLMEKNVKFEKVIWLGFDVLVIQLEIKTAYLRLDIHQSYHHMLCGLLPSRRGEVRRKDSISFFHGWSISIIIPKDKLAL